MVVLGVDALERKIGVGGGESGLVRVLAFDERAARGVAVDDDFEGVVVEVGAGEIPIVVAGLVEKVEAVQAFDSPHRPESRGRPAVAVRDCGTVCDMTASFQDGEGYGHAH